MEIKPIPPKILRHNCDMSSQNVTLQYYSGTKMDRKLIFTMNSNEDAIIFVCMGGQGVKSPLPPIIIICAIHLTNKPIFTYICMAQTVEDIHNRKLNIMTKVKTLFWVESKQVQ